MKKFGRFLYTTIAFCSETSKTETSAVQCRGPIYGFRLRDEYETKLFAKALFLKSFL